MSRVLSIGKGPDYDGLVRLLPKLRCLVDASGWVTLEPSEAAAIRELGFQVTTNRWLVPRIPAHLVAGDQLLGCLANDVDEFWLDSPQLSASDRSLLEAVEAEPLEQPERIGPTNAGGSMQEIVGANEDDCASILAAVEGAGGRTERRRLQKKLWRMKAGRFNKSIQQLVELGLMHVEGKLLLTSSFYAALRPIGCVPQPESDASIPGAPDRVSKFRGRGGNVE